MREIIASVCVLLMTTLAGPVMAGTVTHGFDNGRWGFNSDYGDFSFGSFTNFFYIENSDGKPAPCLRMKSIHGVGIKVVRPEFQGNYKTAGFRRISLDMKIASMFPPPNNPNPRPQIFILPGHGMSPWVKDASGYQPNLNQWQHIWADFDPDWTDGEARANGWEVVVLQGMQSKSFKETMADVYATGLWLKVSKTGSEIHTRFDNYKLGPASHQATPIMKPVQLKPLPSGKMKMKGSYPVRRKSQ